MLRLIAPLFGFALFGAIFAGIYYQPDMEERDISPPKFRLAPGEAKPDFIEPLAFGENVWVNISVLSGGPVDILMVDIEAATLLLLDGSNYTFDFEGSEDFVQAEYSAFDVEATHNFTFVADGVNRMSLFFISNVERPEDWDEMSAEEREPYITEVAVRMRYVDSEAKSLIWGYIFVAPSVLLIGYTLWTKWRREPGVPPSYEYPRDRGL